MHELIIKTKKEREIVDITQDVQRLVPRLKVEDGFCNLFVLHTTAALVTADLDPGTKDDFLDAFEALIPKLQYTGERTTKGTQGMFLDSAGYPLEKMNSMPSQIFLRSPHFCWICLRSKAVEEPRVRLGWSETSPLILRSPVSNESEVQGQLQQFLTPYFWPRYEFV